MSGGFKDTEEKLFHINSDSIASKSKDLIGYFLHGLKLKSYIFEKYKSKKFKKSFIINVIGKNNPSVKDQIKFRAIEEGTFFARDLVSEPGNILHPDEYTKRLNSLKKIYSPSFKSMIKKEKSPYGNGGASVRIVEILKKIKTDNLFQKKFYNIR